MWEVNVFISIFLKMPFVSRPRAWVPARRRGMGHRRVDSSSEVSGLEMAWALFTWGCGFQGGT